MILKPQIFDVIADGNARYKRNELESDFNPSELACWTKECRQGIPGMSVSPAWLATVLEMYY